MLHDNQIYSPTLFFSHMHKPKTLTKCGCLKEQKQHKISAHLHANQSTYLYYCKCCIGVFIKFISKQVKIDSSKKKKIAFFQHHFLIISLTSSHRNKMILFLNTSEKKSWKQTAVFNAFLSKSKPGHNVKIDISDYLNPQVPKCILKCSNLKTVYF